MGNPAKARRGSSAHRAVLAACVFWALLPDLAHSAHLPGGVKGTIVEDFESGGVTLDGYPNQNQQPDDWEVTDVNPYEGSYALRIYGNCWKTQEIDPYPIDATTVWQVAVYVENKGEMNAFGVSDGTHELFYTFAGTELPDPPIWWTVYQGAFPLDQWYAYYLPVGEDWRATHGYDPVLSKLIYVNDDDAAQDVVTVFDAIVDITVDLPVAPVATATHSVRRLTKVARSLYRVDVQFYGDVFDPDSDSHEFFWDFGDSAFSTDQNPSHPFLVHADYTYTVAFTAVDPDGMSGVDTCQVGVEPGAGGLPITVNFVGDVMTARNYETPGGIIDTYGVESIFTPTLAIFGQAADVSVANLECPYTDRGTPHPTKFYTFRSRPENIAGAVYAGIDIANLANNHILDYGLEGMLQTESVLDSVGVLHSGCGMNDTFTRMPLSVQKVESAIAATPSPRGSGTTSPSPTPAPTSPGSPTCCPGTWRVPLPPPAPRPTWSSSSFTAESSTSPNRRRTGPGAGVRPWRRDGRSPGIRSSVSRMNRAWANASSVVSPWTWGPTSSSTIIPTCCRASSPTGASSSPTASATSSWTSPTRRPSRPLCSPSRSTPPGSAGTRWCRPGSTTSSPSLPRAVWAGRSWTAWPTTPDPWGRSWRSTRRR